MNTFTYKIGAGLPNLWLYWRDSDKQLIDFSDDWTFEVKIAPRNSNVAAVIKTEGITGAAGSIEDRIPNLIINWGVTGASVTPGGDFADLDAGVYDVEIRAIGADGRSRYWPEHDPIRINLIPAYSESEPE